MEHTKQIVTLKYHNKQLELLDQTLLPGTTKYITVHDVKGVYDAIRTMKVRGAPAIGICAAYGLVIAAHSAPKSDWDAFMRSFSRDAELLSTSRPTAINLFWAIKRMRNIAMNMPKGAIENVIVMLEAEAKAIEDEDKVTNKKIGEHLLSLLHNGDGVLTHCNAGILATSCYGTALSPLYLAKERGMDIRVYVDETRPLLQGARLTAYELNRSGVDVTLICDNMAAVVMSKGWVQAVITGCDRVAANGDTANKIGTFNLSILAKHFNIPMYIAAPTSTIDLNCPDGSCIPIEERPPGEVGCFSGLKTAPDGISIFNPAFDVTPRENISAIVTEKGIFRPPFNKSLAGCI